MSDLREGRHRKGGQNRTYQTAERPADPPPMRPGTLYDANGNLIFRPAQRTPRPPLPPVREIREGHVPPRLPPPPPTEMDVEWGNSAWWPFAVMLVVAAGLGIVAAARFLGAAP